MTISRRHFIKQSGAIALGFAGLYTLMGCTTHGANMHGQLTTGFGPLQSDPAGVFDLPDKFSYKIISRHGQTMDDGLRVPHRPDGMATFPGENDRTIIIRNHEVDWDSPLTEGPFGKDTALYERFDKSKMYDTGTAEHQCMGGTSTMIFNTKTQKLESQYLSLIGTIRNCAGGPTPWNTWISCEETVEKAHGPLNQDHGWVFEVPSSMSPLVADPVPIKSMGRFNHEAIAVDPESGIVYLTEDRHDSLLYRYIPEVRGKLLQGGKLQALVVKDRESLDTRNWEELLVERNREMDVRWIDLENIEAPEDDLRIRGFEAGAARFARGEGMWYGDGQIYFACTNGGHNQKGQIFTYTPSEDEGTMQEMNNPGTLELFVEPNDTTLIENADNLTVSPSGDLVVCEDGSGDQYLVGITPEGQFYHVGRNAMSDSELAGATFSPDGTTLFVNIQHEGLTLAITGPWQQRA